MNYLHTYVCLQHHHHITVALYYKGQGYMEDFNLVCIRDRLGQFFCPRFLSHIYSMYLCGFNYPINVSFWSHVGFFLRQEDRWRKTLVVWGQYDALQIAFGVWFQRSSD